MKRSKLKRKNRKKYHVGEFQQFGFTILLKTKEADYNVESDREFLDVIYDGVFAIIESEKLSGGAGGGKDYITVCITDTGRKNTVTEDKAKEILKRIKSIDFVIDAESFPLVDCWHFSQEDSDKEDALILDAKNRMGIKDLK